MNTQHDKERICKISAELKITSEEFLGLVSRIAIKTARGEAIIVNALRSINSLSPGDLPFSDKVSAIKANYDRAHVCDKFVILEKFAGKYNARTLEALLN